MWSEGFDDEFESMERQMRRDEHQYRNEQLEYEERERQKRETKLKKFKQREVKTYRKNSEEEILYSVMMLGPEWRIINMQYVDNGSYHGYYLAFVEKTINKTKKKPTLYMKEQ